MNRILAIALFAAALSFSTAVFALDLSQARAQGIVGEKLDGYIGAVTPSAEANAVVGEINARRKAEYEKIAASNGQTVSVVGKVAAEKIINGLPAGSYFQLPNGSWKKK